MTKLAEWLVGVGSAATLWYLLYTRAIETSLSDSEILIGPFVLAGLVATVILAILVYRIRTFNDCPEAAAELRKQIEQARQDLSAKGFKFD